jgi:hypothetical protein
MFFSPLTLFCAYAHFQLCDNAQKYINVPLDIANIGEQAGGKSNADRGRN